MTTAYGVRYSGRLLEACATEYAYIVGKLGEGGMQRLFGVGR